MLNSDQLHEFRKEIDANIKKARQFTEMSVSDVTPENILTGSYRAAEIALTKLQEAKMWVGKILEAIGSEFPEKLRDEAPNEIINTSAQDNAPTAEQPVDPAAPEGEAETTTAEQSAQDLSEGVAAQVPTASNTE